MSEQNETADDTGAPADDGQMTVWNAIRSLRDQVAAAAELLGGDRDRGAVESAYLVLNAEDRDPLVGGPAQDRLDHLSGVPQGMQHQAH
jgi:hypothetical protein